MMIKFKLKWLKSMSINMKMKLISFDSNVDVHVLADTPICVADTQLFSCRSSTTSTTIKVSFLKFKQYF